MSGKVETKALILHLISSTFSYQVFKAHVSSYSERTIFIGIKPVSVIFISLSNIELKFLTNGKIIIKTVMTFIKSVNVSLHTYKLHTYISIHTYTLHT